MKDTGSLLRYRLYFVHVFHIHYILKILKHTEKKLNKNRTNTKVSLQCMGVKTINQPEQEPYSKGRLKLHRTVILFNPVTILKSILNFNV